MRPSRPCRRRRAGWRRSRRAVPMLQLGGATVTALLDGWMSFEATEMFPGMPVELLAAHGGIEDDE